MKRHNFLAFDIGATSGRAVLATFESGKFITKELLRFPNAILEIHGKCYWDIFGLYKSLKEVLSLCAKEKIAIDSIGIDTWGVDFAYLGDDDTLLGLPRAYRDGYTQGKPERYFEQIARQEVYRLTGTQTMPFNSLFQLYAATGENFSPLKQARQILFMPDALIFLLTGKKICEYTIASTSQLVNARTRKIEKCLLEKAGVSPDLVDDPVMPGTVVGTLTETLGRETGLGPVPVIAVAGHDTASAVVAVPALNRNFAYLSSGTWSLMGIEVDEPILTDAAFDLDFTNEGGIEGTIRFLKNITGMWLLEQCRKEWEKAGKDYPYPTLVKMAESARPFYCLVNPDDPSFANPVSMTQAIAAYCRETGQPEPDSDAQIVRTIFESLALRYNQVIEALAQMAPFAIKTLHIIGGGSKNALLNRFTANATRLKVIAGPAEATAIGNLMLQAKTMGLIASKEEMRALIAASVETETLLPETGDVWPNAYIKFKTVTARK